MKLYHFEDSIVALEHLSFATDAPDAPTVATSCFRDLVAEAAEKGWPLDLTRAHWLVDYDMNQLCDRVLVRVAIAGRSEPPIPAGPVWGRFDHTGQAVTA